MKVRVGEATGAAWTGVDTRPATEGARRLTFYADWIKSTVIDESPVFCAKNRIQRGRRDLIVVYEPAFSPIRSILKDPGFYDLLPTAPVFLKSDKLI